MNERFRAAVAAIDAGDIPALERLLSENQALLRERADYGEEGYFHRPYLLWFIAENPIRNGKLPPNIAVVTRTIVDAARRQGVEALPEQLHYTLELVCSGRIARECGVQRELIDLLVDAGADPDQAMLATIAHREIAAAERLLDQGARLTLPVAVCMGRTEEARQLAANATPEELQNALAIAALYGKADLLAMLVDAGADVDAHAPAVHPHGTPLHHAVDSGSLDAVRVLVDAGASRQVRDHIHDGTPLEWADYLERHDIAAYLRAKETT